MKVLQKLHAWARGNENRNTARPRPKAALGVERLGERVVPTASPIVFQVYDNGTWAQNLDTGDWRKISNAQPSAMDEGANGTLFASFSDGTKKYNYASNSWTLLASAQTSVLDAAWDNTMVGSYPNGTWEWDGDWGLITEVPASDVSVVNDNHAYLEIPVGYFGGHSGIWQWKYQNGDHHWQQRSYSQAVAMEAASDGTLFASLVSGNTYRMFSGGGSSLVSNSIASAIAASWSGAAAFSFNTGTYGWDQNEGFTLYTTTQTTQLHNESSYGVIGVFNTGTYWITDSGALGVGTFSLEQLTYWQANLL